jgi:hypothetical protein
MRAILQSNTNAVASHRLHGRGCGLEGANRQSMNVCLTRFQQLSRSIIPLRNMLLDHPIYAAVTSLIKLRIFMQIHVFAVWDFMSLAKRLQHELTCIRLPWTPPARASIARFAHEVVLGEESDLGPDGKPISHFELYLRAMDEVGAEATEVRRLISQLDLGVRWEDAIQELIVPPGVTAFVNDTLRCAIEGSLVEVASWFFFGREDVIPAMFKRLLARWCNAKVEVPHFVYYLERHIALDGDSHRPWAQQILAALAGQSELNWQEATNAAENAINSRIRLWDTAYALIKSIGD